MNTISALAILVTSTSASLSLRPIGSRAIAENACCNAISVQLPGKVLFANETGYQKQRQSYWAEQASQIAPTCIVVTESTNDIAHALRVLSSPQASNSSCKFAIRSGGHGTFDAATIQGGVNIDLSLHTGIELDQATNVVSIQPAAKWGDVYEYLEPRSRTVAGGRSADVGVGGLTLGGGLSYSSPKAGFVCDNVVNFEVVLASGDVVNANANEHTDLFVALRGGGNNFGVVTRFDFRTLPQVEVWSSAIYYPLSTASQQLQALYDFTSGKAQDENATVIQSFAYSASLGGGACANNLVYTAPVESPASLQGFTAIQPQAVQSTGLTNTSTVAITQSMNNPAGFRELMATTTFVSNYDMLVEAFNLWNATLPLVQSIANLTWAWSNEPMPLTVLSKSTTTGGDSLGLGKEKSPLNLGLLTASWTNVADDDLVETTARKLIESVAARAKQRGVYSDFTYLNYAGPWQKNISGYGLESLQNLFSVSHKYDPRGMFQKDVLGGFKLF